MQTTINMSETLQEESVPPALEDTPTLEATPTQQEEGTPSAAIAPLEEEIIDGEVTAIIEPESRQTRLKHKPQPKHPPYYLIVVGTVLACLLYLAASLLLPLLTPSATVTIIPVKRTITTTAAIQVHGRQLPPLTLSQSAIVPATGKRHQDATEAHSTITFYNGLLSPQTIASGTVLTGNDGVHVITDQLATIPAANPPVEGQVMISAHALSTGTGGNIPAYDINQACCATSVVAKNTQDFSGGASARDYLVATRTDINNAVTSLLIPLSQSENAALQAQLHTGEEWTTQSCTPHVSTDHRPGDEAKQISVTVSVTCEATAYDARTLHLLATQIETSQPALSGYTVFGEAAESVVHATISDQARGIVTLTVKLEATYIYQITPGETQQLAHLIAGKSTSSALHTLLSMPGIQAASIHCTGGDILPHDPSRITISIQYSVVSSSRV